MRSITISVAVALLLTATPTLAKTVPPSSAVQQTPQPVPAEVPAVNPWQVYAACIVEQQRYQAEITRLQGICQSQADQARACIARVRDRQGSSTARGALIGLGAAVVTGGASLLFTGAGALVGHATGDQAEGECGTVPSCDPSSLDARAQAAGIRDRDCQMPTAQTLAQPTASEALPIANGGIGPSVNKEQKKYRRETKIFSK